MLLMSNRDDAYKQGRNSYDSNNENATGNLPIDTMQKILNSKKIRYEKLNSLFENVVDFRQYKGRQMNIYVDIQSVIKQLYSPETLDILQYIKAEDRMMITSEIVNIVGHYRHYFASRCNMFTRFYFFYSFSGSHYHKELYPEYRSEYYSKRNSMRDPVFGGMNKTVLNNMRTIKLIMKYIPNAYFVDMAKIEPSLLPNFVIRELAEPEDLNMILSNDELFYQDLNISDNVFMLEMRGSEKSRLIHSDNVIESLLSGTKKTPDEFMEVDSSLIKVIQSMTSHKNYSLNSVARKGNSTAIALINKLIVEGKLDPLQSNNIDYRDDIASLLFKKEDDVNEFKIRNRLLDHDYIVDVQFDTIESLVSSQLIDIRNDIALRDALDVSFQKFFIDIQFAFEGEG